MLNVDTARIERMPLMSESFSRISSRTASVRSTDAPLGSSTLQKSTPLSSSGRNELRECVNIQ